MKTAVIFKLIVISALLLSTGGALGQTVLFPGVSGQALLDSLVLHYKTQHTLGYNGARDAMYGLIDNRNDSVTCVYSGYQVYVPYNAPNPRDYTNAANPIINAEHTWPQSKGADSGNPRSDLHHLFPTNERPNSARGSLAFNEVADPQTNTWYRRTEVRNSIPATHIDEYSESLTGVTFEPREDHKGNVARAMFYFYTMYKAEADAADPAFFNQQKEVLRQWNSMDPVDGAEIGRTQMIAAYQDNCPNPFVLDTTLIGRAYFGVVSGVPENGSVQIPRQLQVDGNYPNPFNPSTEIRYRIATPAMVELTVFDGLGRLVEQRTLGVLSAGDHRLTWQAGQLSSGVYYYRLTAGTGTALGKMLLLR